MLFQKITGEGELSREETAGGLNWVLGGGLDENAVGFFQDVDPTARGHAVFLPEAFRNQNLTFLRNLNNSHENTPMTRKYNFIEEVVKSSSMWEEGHALQEFRDGGLRL
jgi:hypothetical protein